MKHLVLYVIIITLLGCGNEVSQNKGNQVNLYCALDQIFSEPILKDIEKDSNVKVNQVFDTEATKTVGLVNRIIAEKKFPKCDIFWNNEIIRTIHLKRQGLLKPFLPDNSSTLPASFVDKEHYWTGFAARARVIIYNKNLIKVHELPKKTEDLLDPKWKGKFAMALPLFGTTATHVAALYSHWGPEKALTFFQKLKENKVSIVAGNSVAKDVVVRGELPFALTDTDDAFLAMKKNSHIDVIFLDQEGFGALVIPNTVCLIKGAPNESDAKKVINLIVSEQIEQKLALCGSAQMPLRSHLKPDDDAWNLNDIKPMNVDWENITDMIEQSTKDMRSLFYQ